MWREALSERDGLRRFEWQGKEVLLHEDHRWVLPLVADAQERGLLPRPTRVILFDRHTDAAEPGPLTPGHSPAHLVEVCEQELSRHDDDWIVAGIRLGLLADVFLYGVDDRMGELPKAVGDYGIYGRFEMPAQVGPLGRNAQAVIDWTESPILLDIDLDCFAYPYRGRVLPWDEELFAHEFGPSLRAWQEFLRRAGLVTICREAGCCGGEANAERIWERFSRTLLPGLTPR